MLVAVSSGSAARRPTIVILAMLVRGVVVKARWRRGRRVRVGREERRGRRARKVIVVVVGDGGVDWLVGWFRWMEGRGGVW